MKLILVKVVLFFTILFCGHSAILDTENVKKGGVSTEEIANTIREVLSS